MDDNQFKKLLNALQLSWRGYRKVRKGVKKRLNRHMDEIGCRDISAYLARITRDHDIRRECNRRLTVTISRFFRDRRLWDVLGRQLLPELIGTHRTQFKVWSAGCACGEEVYSFKIIWEALAPPPSPLPRLKILATDLNIASLQRARSGIYPRSSLKELPEKTRELYFSSGPAQKRFRIREDLQHGILWMVHDFHNGPPAREFQLIFLRNNLLTYFNPAIVEPVFREIIACLAPGGALIVGAHEHPPEHPHLQHRKDLSPHIYTKM